MLIVYSVYIIAVQFTFTPYPEAKIEAHQPVHYQCSVDHTSVRINWLVNGTGSANTDIIRLDIITYGAGSHNSSLAIPGYLQYNNTVVRCNAFGTVNGNSYFNFNESILRIQGNILFGIHFNYSVFLGKLAKVVDLECKIDQYSIVCTWSPPFSLVPIPGYVVNVTTFFNGEISQHFIANTTLTFWISPSEFDNYTATISVAGNNPAGEGEISTIKINKGEL